MERKEQTAPPASSRSVWVPIIIVCGVAVLLLVLLIVGAGVFSHSGDVASPVLLPAGSAYRMYELRNDEVLLSYTIQLRNDSDEDMAFTLRATMPQDQKSGYLTSPDAAVRLRDGDDTLSLSAGTTRSFDIIVTAQHSRYGGPDKPSGALPQLYAVFDDGNESLIRENPDA